MGNDISRMLSYLFYCSIFIYTRRIFKRYPREWNLKH